MKEEPKGVEREPLAAGGLAGALKVAAQKGYIEKDLKRTGMRVVIFSVLLVLNERFCWPSLKVQVDQKHKERISAASYSIEDKNRVDHLDKYAADKYRRDRREKTSNLVEFCEKKDYKPLVTVSVSAIDFSMKLCSRLNTSMRLDDPKPKKKHSETYPTGSMEKGRERWSKRNEQRLEAHICFHFLAVESYEF